MMKMLYSNRKGQITTADLVAGLTILILILQFNYSIWSKSVYDIRQKDTSNEIEFIALSVSDFLLKYEGKPSDWEQTNNTIAIGLAKEDHVLDSDKVSAFLDMNYTQAKKLLGIGENEYLFRLKKTDGTILNQSGLVASSPELAVNIRRLVLYNDSPTYIEFMVWR